MNYFLLIVEVVSGISVIVGALVAFRKAIQKVEERQEAEVEGQRCLLRSDMLHTYYKNKDNGTIRQYELENFMLLYTAYKALKGNSFIDKIYNEAIEWEVIK